MSQPLPVVQHLPAGWSRLASGVYSRPLVASEASIALRNRSQDGHNDVCMGFTFCTTIIDIVDAMIDAIVRLRIIAPLVAADISHIPEYNDVLCWVYRPITSISDARDWATRSLMVHDPAPSDEEFIAATNQSRLPYTMPSHSQYVGYHLLLRPNGEHSFYIHGTHAIFDAQPHLYAFHHIFSALSGGEATPMERVSWGEEIGNLPVDLIQMFGDVPVDEEGSNGLELPPNLRSDKPSLGLVPQRTFVEVPARPARVQRKLNSGVLQDILAQLKPFGLSLTVLCEASLVLATFASNISLPENPHVTLDLTVIALQRFFPPQYRPAYHITSSMIFVPIVAQLADFGSKLTVRERLVAIMTVLRQQYGVWLEKPNIMFADIIRKSSLHVHRNPYAPFITNLGVLDRYVDSTWTVEGVDNGIEVLQFRLGHRIIDFHRPAVHVWTFRKELNFQVESTDVYDPEYLEGFIDAMISIMLHILDDE